jgi:7-cyano-7-deazaguanine reductase
MAQAGSSLVQAGEPQFANPDSRLAGGYGGLSMHAGLRDACSPIEGERQGSSPAQMALGQLEGPDAKGVSAGIATAAADDALPQPPPRLIVATNSAAPSPSASEPPSPSAAPAAPAERTRTPAYGERLIEAAELLCFANPRPGRPFEISIELPEFTCKCPFSGYPDFAVLSLLYQPGPRVLELKAIKLYVNSYRDRSISHEEVANRILDDLVEACEPVWMQLTADFNPRGNVHTVVRVSHGTRQPC